jgi:hypothetical protein
MTATHRCARVGVGRAGHRVSPTRVWSVAVALGALVGAGLLIASPSDTTDAGALLNAYSQGDYPAVTQTLTAHRGTVGAFARGFEDVATTWLADSPKADWPRDRLVAASVALEAARTIKWQPTTVRPGNSQWLERLHLLEWGASLLRETTPAPPTERSWQLGAVSLVEQSFGFPFYAALAHEEDRRVVEAGRQRFPEEGRIALAEPIIDTEAAGFLGYPLDDLPNAPLDSPGYDVEVRESPNGSADLLLRPSRGSVSFPADPHNFRVLLRAAVRGYSALLTRPEIGPEAQVRLGALEVYLDQPDLAYRHLDMASQGTSDPVFEYATRFFRGAALTRLGQVQQAEVAFRDALAAIPHAESATMGLAWLLVLNQHRAEADRLTADQLQAGPPSPDPLAAFAEGDARFCEARIAELRAGLARK